MGKLSVKNPQNNDYVLSRRFAYAQDIFGVIAFILAVVQGITTLMPAKSFLVISGLVLFLEYIASYYKGIHFENGHRKREAWLIDNSFHEKRIPNYNSETYYDNSSVTGEEIRLLANIHENSLYTSRIAEKMARPYYYLTAFSFILFVIGLFFSGLNDYTSLLLSFIVSSSLLDRAMKLNALTKSTSFVFEKINGICNEYEKQLSDKHLILSQIIEVLLLYENVIFESKIILSERIFHQFNDSLKIEWFKIRDSYVIYGNQKETES